MNDITPNGTTSQSVSQIAAIWVDPPPTSLSNARWWAPFRGAPLVQYCVDRATDALAAKVKGIVTGIPSQWAGSPLLVYLVPKEGISIAFQSVQASADGSLTKDSLIR